MRSLQKVFSMECVLCRICSLYSQEHYGKLASSKPYTLNFITLHPKPNQDVRFAAALVAYGDLLATNTGEHARAQEMYQVCP